jgi:hypothetical protein
MKSLCLFLLLGTTAIYAADGPDQTFGMKNGRFWSGLPSDDATRSAFLIGLFEGWHLRGDTQPIVPGSVIIAMNVSGRFTTDDLATMITSVYADTENLALPVGWVTMGCLAVQRGDTTRDLVFMALRKHLAGLMNRRDGVASSEVDAVNVIMQLRPH